MSTKAKSIEEQPIAAPLPISSEPFVLERLNLQNRPVNQADKTTQLVLLWNGMKGELQKARKATFDYAIICADGELEIFDHDGLAKAWSLVEARESQLSNAEQAIRIVIEAGGQYLREVENIAYAHSQTAIHDKRRMDGLFIELQRRNPDLPPDKIPSLPDFVAFKKEMDAEIQHSAEILEQTRAKIEIYNKAFGLAGI